LCAFLIAAGLILFLAYRHWFLTRTWVAADVPISLAPGRFSSGDFYINLRADYHIGIEPKDNGYTRDPNCQAYQVIHTRWRLYHDGRVFSTWKSYLGIYLEGQPDRSRQGAYLGSFDGIPGHYTLEGEMVTDATCLEEGGARLRIYAEDFAYSWEGSNWLWLQICSVALVGFGCGLLGVSAAGTAERPKITPGYRLAIFDTAAAAREPARRKLLLMGIHTPIPNVGYIYALTYLVLFSTLATFQMSRWWTSQGITVELPRTDTIQAESGQSPALLVYVDSRGGMYLNSKPMTADQLPRALEYEFARRADWSVYVEGDENATVRDVMAAMDLVRGVNGEVIMLTPGMRAEIADRSKR
jgi:biopolymer transport protein ExbD